MATATARRRRAVEHVIATEFARDRIARALFDVIADGLDLRPCTIRTAEDQRWVREMIALVIQASTDAALERTSAELAGAVAEGPPDLVVRMLGVELVEPDAGDAIHAIHAIRAAPASLAQPG
jgi:hypothetical protein